MGTVKDQDALSAKEVDSRANDAEKAKAPKPLTNGMRKAAEHLRKRSTGKK